MPNAPVSVEIAPPESNDALRAALLDACTRTVKSAECVESAPESTPPSVVAIVSFKDPQNVHLEVAVRPEPQWVVRDIRFAPGDPLEERWRAVGLVIGTLASVMTKHEEPAPPAPALPPTPPPPAAGERLDERGLKEAPSNPVATARRAGWLGAGAILAPALDTGPIRLGAEVSGHLHLGSLIYGTAGFGLSQSTGRVSDVKAAFTEGFGGIAFDLRAGRDLSLVGRVEAFVERFAPSVGAEGNAPTSGERWLGGARLGADVIYWGTSPLGFFLGVTGRVASGATEVRVAEQVVGVAPSVAAIGRAGVTIAFE